MSEVWKAWKKLNNNIYHLEEWILHYAVACSRIKDAQEIVNQNQKMRVEFAETLRKAESEK